MFNLFLGIISTIILSILSANLYRMGGQGKPYNTKHRDVGCALTLVLNLIIISYLSDISIANHFAILSFMITFGLTFASLTTYWKIKGQPARWYNWMYVGLGISFATLPYTIYTGNWMGFLYRLITLTLAITISSEKIGNDVKEEKARGLWILLTSPLLLI